MKVSAVKLGICGLLCSLFLFSSANAVDTAALEKDLPAQAREYLQIAPDSGDLKSGISGLMYGITDLAGAELRKVLSEGILIIGIASACGLAAAAGGPLHADVLTKALETTSICAAAGLCLHGASSVLQGCSDSIAQLSGFSGIFIPIYGAAVAVSGHPVSAMSVATATLVASNLLLILASRLLIPSIYLHIILTAVGRIAENGIILSLASVLKKGALAFFKYFLMLYTGYVSLSGLISSGSDALTLRTAKMTLSGTVPVLGSVISDVSEALLGGAVILKNAVGIYGFLGAVAICLSPFVSVALRLVVFRFLSILAGGLGGGSMTGMLSDISESYSIALGLLGTCCVILFLSFVIGSVVIST